MKLTGSSAKHEILKKVPLFRNLDKKHLDEIAKKADEVHMEAGTVLASQGNVGQEFVFILEGTARVEKDGQVINRLSANNFFGEIALIDGNPRAASVIADTDMDMLVIHARFFQSLLESVPGMAKEIAVALCGYLRRSQDVKN